MLKATTWFGDMPEAVRGRLERKFVEKEVAAGAVLQAEGEATRAMWVVGGGEIVRSRGGVVLDVLGVNEVTGMLHCFRGDPAHATLTAGKGGCRCWELKREALLDAVRGEPGVAEELLGTIAQALRSTLRVKAPAKQGDRARVAVFDAKAYDRQAFGAVESEHLRFDFVAERLSEHAAGAAAGCAAVCIFVNDVCSAPVLDQLARLGVCCVALRCAGYDNVDIDRAAALGIDVVRVPSYSPHAVAEHALAMLMTLNRKTHLAYARARMCNFSLQGLTGFDVYGKAVAVVGTGKIGKASALIFKGMGCKVLCFDAFPDRAWADLHGVEYVPLDDALAAADVVTLHVPLLPATHHLVSADAIARMKRGVIVLNTSRGAIVDTDALIAGLRSGHVGAAGLDVYEYERGLFFDDHSGEIMAEQFSVLTSLPNVLITGHQAFLTHEALFQIASTTVANLLALLRDGKSGDDVPNRVKREF